MIWYVLGTNNTNKGELKMDLNELTLGQIKELQTIFTGTIPETNNSFLKSAIGKYVIVRSRNEGINTGVVESLDSTGIILKDARRIYFHAPKDKKLSWYEGVAVSGLSDSSKISGTVERKYIIEDYSITIVSKEAEDNIRGFKANAQN